MRVKTLLLILSIFCVSNICKAQSANPYNFLLCDVPPGKISQVKLSKIIDGNCRFFNFTDSVGNILEIVELTLAFVPADGSTVYIVNMYKGEKLTAETKNQLKNAKNGDQILISEIKSKIGENEVLLEGVEYLVVN